MQELSRVNLYKMVLQELEEVTRETWYYQGEVSVIKRVLKTNIFMLDGIEDMFFIGRELENLEEEALKEQIADKISLNEDAEFRGFLERTHRKVPNKNERVMSFLNYLNQSEKHWDVVTLFSHIMI